MQIRSKLAREALMRPEALLANDNSSPSQLFFFKSKRKTSLKMWTVW